MNIHINIIDNVDFTKKWFETVKSTDFLRAIFEMKFSTTPIGAAENLFERY